MKKNILRVSTLCIALILSLSVFCACAGDGGSEDTTDKKESAVTTGGGSEDKTDTSDTDTEAKGDEPTDTTPEDKGSVKIDGPDDVVYDIFY